MVRVLLAITLIAIGASGWFAFNNVSTKIDDLSSTLTTTEGERDTAIQAQADAEDAQKAAVAYSTAHPETPVENDKRVDEANSNIGVTKISYESIKESGKLNITMAETKLGKAQAVLEIAQRYLSSF